MPDQTRFFARPPTLRDRAARLGYRAGYRMMRVIWRVFPPRHVGVGILVWHGGRLLAVRHSYRPGLVIPGGRRNRGEEPADAASRELAEELGIEAPPDAFEYLRTERNTHLYALHLDAPPAVRPDSREIVEAVFLTPDEARAASGFLRRLLRGR